MLDIGFFNIKTFHLNSNLGLHTLFKVYDILKLLIIYIYIYIYEISLSSQSFTKKFMIQNLDGLTLKKNHAMYDLNIATPTLLGSILTTVSQNFFYYKNFSW